MGQVKSIEDRIQAIEEECSKQCAHLELWLDPTDKRWSAYIDEVEIGEPGSFTEMLETLESELDI